MASIEEKIKEIEEEIKDTPYNKASQHHIGKLKAKLAQLKEELIKKSSKKGSGLGFGLKKSGDATVVLVGFPSVGKSTLLNQLTNAESAVAEYEFTTLKVIPGAMDYRGAKMQLLDLPGIITGASVGKGRGKEIMSIARNSDLVLMIVDCKKPEQADVIRRELYDVGIRLDKRPPRVRVRKKIQGGVKTVSSTRLTKLNDETIRSILNANGIHNADVVLHEDIDDEAFIDVVMKNRAYVPSLLVFNKIDLLDDARLTGLKSYSNAVHISASAGLGLDVLREAMYIKLGLIRLYMKKPGQEPDTEEPLIMQRGARIKDVIEKLRVPDVKYALVWGKSVKYPGQRKGLNHVLEDADIVTLVTKNA